MAEDVLRLAGFMEGINYHKQRTLEGGSNRPDFTFLLPRDLKLNMDVKFPFDNYLRYLEAGSEMEKENCKSAFFRDVRERVRELRRLGFRIAIDDLGAGYAGLASFAVLEPDLVKLDGVLVKGVDREPIKRKLIGSITLLCRELGILVVAEGVETLAERDALVEQGCDLIQGFFVTRRPLA